MQIFGYFSVVFTEYFFRYFTADFKISCESSKSPNPWLHFWHKNPRTALVLWSWSKCVLLPISILLEQIAHLLFWRDKILLTSFNVSPNFFKYFELRFLSTFEFLHFLFSEVLHGLQVYWYPSPRFVLLRLNSEKGFKVLQILQFFIDTPISNWWTSRCIGTGRGATPFVHWWLLL